MVHVTLAVLRSKELKARLRGRGVLVPQRRAKRYLNKFETIWSLQAFLLSEADRCDVPIITNLDKEKTILQVILHVNYELSKQFTGTPREVFGETIVHLIEQGETADWRDLIPMLAG